MSLLLKIKREIKAKPLKAAGLGVLLLVAAYFWAPLLRGMIAPREAAPATPASNPGPVAAAATGPGVPAAPAPAAQAAAPTSIDSVIYDWRKYANLIDEDAAMRAGAALPGSRDPFVSPQPPAPEKPAEEPKVAAGPITPAEAGLLLTTTLLGARKKIAEISGKSYTIGDRVKVLTDEFNASFRVVEIYPRRVILESHGKRYELRIPRPLLDAVVDARDGNSEAADDEGSDSDAGETIEEKTSDGPSKPQDRQSLTD
jgi:hypothetical protein